MDQFKISKSLFDAVVKVLLSEHEMTRGEVAASNVKYETEILQHKNKTKEISGHIFPENVSRLTIPLIEQDHPTKMAVESHLHSNEFHSTDYLKGMTFDKHNRAVSIGKALTKSYAPKELIDSFATHQKTYSQEPDHSNLQVVISKDPHDVIGMSQGTQWGLRDGELHSTPDKHIQSCMRFGTDQHDRYMTHELRNGTHIAWLTNKGDNEAKEPISRITLRPFEKVNSLLHHKDTVPGTYVKIAEDSMHKIYGHGTSPDDKLIEASAAKIGDSHSARYSHYHNGEHFYKTATNSSNEDIDHLNSKAIGSGLHGHSIVNYHIDDMKTLVSDYHFSIPKDRSNLHTDLLDKAGVDSNTKEDNDLHFAVDFNLTMRAEDDEYNPRHLEVSHVDHLNDTDTHHHYRLHLDTPANGYHIKEFINDSISYHNKIMHSPLNRSGKHIFDGSTLVSFPDVSTSDTAPKHTVLVPGGKIYGKHSDAFLQTVNAWAKQNFPMHSGSRYQATPGTYLDGDDSVVYDKTNK